jgi:hypothetical protein
MRNAPVACLILATALGAATPVLSAGMLPQIDPGVIVNYTPEPQHSSVVPLDPSVFGNDLPGQGKSEAEIMQELKENSQKLRPLIGGDTPTPVGGGPLAAPSEDEDRDYALACEISEHGELALANVGGETMPSGLRIRWKAGDRGGYLRLNVDLQPRSRAAMPGLVAAGTVRSCWATVI